MIRMTRYSMRLRFAASVLFLCCSSLTAQKTPRYPPVPRFEESACAVAVPNGERVRCGYLVVPENRSRRNAKTIRLPIVILKSDAPNSKPDPVLRTLGGPGSSSLRMINGRRSSPWLKERDQIIFEQRGTKYSQPALDCPEVGDALVASARLQLSEAETARHELDAVRRCRARLLNRGIDLAAYNSKESAADIEDLRRALNLKTINLYGVSYSARLMLEVMRDYPAHIRSVVLESTLPLEINYDEVGVDAIARVLDLLFAECRNDPGCASTYPKLESDFDELIKASNAHPFIMKVKDSQTTEEIGVKLNGRDIVTWLADYVLSSNGREIAAGPYKIHQLIRGERAPLDDYARAKLSRSSNSLGMRYSVWCREEFPFESRRKIERQSRAYQRLDGYVVQRLPDVCPVWNVPPAARSENLRVKSGIPTLILAGRYDAYTPPAWGRATARNLANSFYFEVPWVGHGPGFNSPACLNEMVANFFNDPATRPDSACLTKIQSLFNFKVN